MASASIDDRPLAIGVDGCRGRWAVVTGRMERGDSTPRLADLTVQLVDDLSKPVRTVRGASPGLAAIAVDMPIGLFADGPRPCDREARTVLGSRRSTVFPAPLRPTLVAADYTEACELSRAASGKALSKQAFNLIPAIRQLDDLLRPEDATAIVEAHPECAFTRLAGHPLGSKHTQEGSKDRRGLLCEALGGAERLEQLVDHASATRVPLVDLYDAAVLTITATRVLTGTEIRLGGELDPTGKPAQVVY